MRYTGKKLREDVELINEVWDNSPLYVHVVERDGDIYPRAKWCVQVRRKSNKAVVDESNYGTPLRAFNWLADFGQDILKTSVYM